MNYFSDKYVNVCPGVYVWEDFLSAEELVPIMEELNAQDYSGNHHVFGLKSFAQYKERIFSSLNSDDLAMPDLDNCIRREYGEGMEPHVDIQNHANPLYYNIVDENADVEKINMKIGKFGAIIYFNDNYEGGEIEYPQHNYSYKPKAGSLVLHEATNIHAVVRVKSGFRFTHSSYIQDSAWIDKKAYDSISWPETDFTLEDPRFWYSLSHGPSENPGLAEFQKTYVPDGRYWGHN